MSSYLHPPPSSLPTSLFPASPTSRAPAVIGNSRWSTFAVPPTPEFSPTTTDAAHFQPFTVGIPETATETEHEPIELEPETKPKKPRTIVLCFDGTGNKFGENSNVVRFFRALIKTKRDEQIIYYQPGIGTYNKHAFFTHTVTTLASTLDSAIALDLSSHAKDGYKFLIQTYHPGDKICLFGFSRGAHIARVVAGMLYKVGIIPKENIQQVDFAFNIYGTTGYQGYKLSREFKHTFASPVTVDFVGVWDTVSSVGIIPRMHPYTSVNYGIKTFRHALALDERRARFRPNVWNEVTPGREQELDVDIPDPKAIPDNTTRDNWTYEAPDRDFADVEEVWFAGCHADVGGGSHSTRRGRSLSFIPLRWMIKECILAKTGILFDFEYLKESLNFDFNGLLNEMREKNIKVEDLGEGYKEAFDKYVDKDASAAPPSITVQPPTGTQTQTQPASGNQLANGHHHHFHLGRHLLDIRDNIFDQLLLVWLWWLIEIIPTLCTYQDAGGNWIRLRMRNLGRGRYIPFHKKEVLVHESVEKRIREVGYTPNAYNWEQISPMIKYVK